MIKKIKISDEVFYENIQKCQTLINNNANFLFYFSYDPDAIGSSVTLSLFLKKLNKECFIYQSDPIDQNLNFLMDMAVYNGIKIIKSPNKLSQIIKKKLPVFIICDTPTHFLLPDFEKIDSLKKELELNDSIEIDHHFGGDSEQIYKSSIILFREANSTCEIIANYLEIVGKDDKGNIDLEITFPRNIVLSLLVGICFDTQLGKFITNDRIYNKWFDFLSNRLDWLTWGNPDNLNNATKVFERINRMNTNRKRIIKNIVKKTVIKNKVGLLIVPFYEKYQSLCDEYDPTCIFAKIIPDIANKTTEYSGAIGIVVFFDTINKIYYIKMRRAQKFKKYDLRNTQQILKEIFKTDYLGGGGHEGATSYRIAFIERDHFVDKINKFHQKLSSIIEELIYSNSSHN